MTSETKYMALFIRKNKGKNVKDADLFIAAVRMMPEDIQDHVPLEVRYRRFQMLRHLRDDVLEVISDQGGF